MIDKNQAIIDFLITCPQIKDSPMYFNFVNAKDNNKQLITLANDTALNRNYTDGSKLKRYTFTIIDFRSVNYQAIVKLNNFKNENVEELLDVQGIIEWITQQNNLRNFPDFGETCTIEDIQAVTENPNLNGIDTSTTPPLAKYSISVKIQYIDTSDVLWNK